MEDKIKQDLETQAFECKSKFGSDPDDSGLRQKDGKLYENNEKVCPSCGNGFMKKKNGRYECPNCSVIL